MQIGSMVVLHGLKSAAELNDQRGEIESFVQESSRWRVKLLDGAVKDLKAENLRLLDAKETLAFTSMLAYLVILQAISVIYCVYHACVYSRPSHTRSMLECSCLWVTTTGP